jgi:hypothetical protein
LFFIVLSAVTVGYRDRQFFVFRVRLAAVLLAFFAVLGTGSVRVLAADDRLEPRDATVISNSFGSYEVWVGAEVARRAWSVYSGLTWAPLGSISADGLRFRASGGSGAYRYDGSIGGVPTSIYGTPAFADLLVGYQMGFGALTLKAFVGASFDAHELEPYDKANALAGSSTGVKGALEGWLNVTPEAWAAVDLAATTAHSNYSTRLRLGYRVLQGLSLGVEAGAFGHVEGNFGRVGALVRYDWAGGEISVSGGVTGNLDRPSTPYVAIMYLAKF